MKNYLILGLFLIAFYSCNKDDDQQNSENNCADTFCTLELRSIIVKVKDANDNAVLLDNVEVIDSDSKEIIIDETYNDQTSNGSFFLYGDSIEDNIINTERKLIFKGYINNNEVISSNYVVSSDCCHVFLVEGNLDLTIE